MRSPFYIHYDENFLLQISLWNRAGTLYNFYSSCVPLIYYPTSTSWSANLPESAFIPLV